MTDPIHPIHPIQEDDLHAYVDGRLPEARRAELDRLRAEDPALAARLASWQRQCAALRDAFAARHREPVPPALHVGRLIEARLHPGRARWRIAAAILLAVSAGGAGGWFARAAQRPNDIAWLTLQAASAHRVFAADDVTQVPPDDPATLRHWMSDRLGQPASVPDLSPMGYRFRGGRVLAAVGGPAAMLIYDAADGARVTIYVQPMRGALVTPMRPVEDHAIGGYAWIARQIGYSVMSADDASAAAQSAIHRLANQVRDQMATPS